jgi:hypothetical protein
MPIKKPKSKQKGKGFMDSLSNAVLSNKHNRALPGEKHQVIYLSDGTYNPAVYSGPGTNLSTRIKRGDQPLSYVDKTAEAHDLRYALANNNQDIRTADLRMVQSLKKARASKLDSNFNLNQAELIHLQILLEKAGAKPEWFTSYGRASETPSDITMYESKLKELEQQGFGMSHAGIHLKHLKKRENKIKYNFQYIIS